MRLRKVARCDLKLGDIVISALGSFKDKWRGADETKGLGWVVRSITPFELLVQFNDQRAEKATGSMAEFYHILDLEPLAPVDPEWGEVAP